jgi:[CysO sulfur-carrier protein]-S-L-cysteine hydrolase
MTCAFLPGLEGDGELFNGGRFTAPSQVEGESDVETTGSPATAAFTAVSHLRSRTSTSGARTSGAWPLQTEPDPVGILVGVLHVDALAYSQMIALAYDGLPLEACGLLGGKVGGPVGSRQAATVTTFYPSVNAANSSKVYTIDPKTHLRAERDAEDVGNEIIGVMHSHTHTDPYPSPTDIAQAPDPGWHYVIVSLRDTAPMLRSYRIVDGVVHEEPVVVTGR